MHANCGRILWSARKGATLGMQFAQDRRDIFAAIARANQRIADSR